MKSYSIAITASLVSLSLGCAKSSSGDTPSVEVSKSEPVETVKTPEVTESAEKKAAPTTEATTRTLTADQSALIFDSPIQTLEGTSTTLAEYRGKQLLLVNVASECGLTPQYERLQKLQHDYGERGFTVIGFPSNQFGGQEPGSPEEILAFGKEKYNVSFPLMEKVDTNGENRHAIYQGLTAILDGKEEAGDVKWNFEKFLVSKDGKSITRFRPQVAPDDPALVKILEADL